MLHAFHNFSHSLSHPGEVVVLNPCPWLQTRQGEKAGLFWIISPKGGGERAAGRGSRGGGKMGQGGRDNVMTVPAEPKTQGPGVRGTEVQLLMSGLEP